MPAKPKTIDEYLATVSDDQQAALEKLRRTIKSAAPKAEECFSYGLPAFRLNGKVIAGFCAFKNRNTLAEWGRGRTSGFSLIRVVEESG